MLLLVLAVATLHLVLVQRHWPTRLGDGAGQAPIRRMEVAFVRELQPSAPPPALRSLRAVPRGAAVAGAGFERPAWASVPEPVAPALPELAGAAAPAPVPPEAAEPTPVPFEWPPSTRLSYRLQGHYRGPVEGYARVEWLRRGPAYQVVLDAFVGPPFAPLFGRRVTSEGRITPAGLWPERFEEETRVLAAAPRRLSIEFGEQRLRYPGGHEVERPPGVQDSASQFVQMAWLFTVQPALLQPGTRVDFPIALPRSVRVWSFELLAAEPQRTPAGPVPVVHVRPTLPAERGDLTAEFWVAPGLQNLPVRIRIHNGGESWLELELERLPQQALPEEAAASGHQAEGGNLSR